jgi:holo-[acyl-carrier protein] synthase
MIIGIGTDIVKTERIKELLEKHGESFLSKIFTDSERREGASRKNSIIYFAGRWAAKEAAVKALGCGFGAECSWNEVEVLNTPEGRPQLAFSGAGAETADRLGVKNANISISHEKEYAVAFAVLEK